MNKPLLSKSEVRSRYRQKRACLSDDDIERFNQHLLRRFTGFNFLNIQFIHFFLPIIKRKEPDTYPMIHWLRKNHPEIKVVVSRTNTNTYLMESFLWDGSEKLQVNSWGIDEPVSGVRVLPQQLDAVIVPLLAYDTQGNRVGYGKGFYDRFLLSCRADCQKIGLSFFDPLQGTIDTDEHDVKLDFCISVERCWRF